MIIGCCELWSLSKVNCVGLNQGDRNMDVKYTPAPPKRRSKIYT